MPALEGAVRLRGAFAVPSVLAGGRVEEGGRDLAATLSKQEGLSCGATPHRVGDRSVLGATFLNQLQLRSHASKNEMLLVKLLLLVSVLPVSSTLV